MIKQWMKRSKGRVTRPAAQQAPASTPTNGREPVAPYEHRRLETINTVDKGIQILLKLKYRELLHSGMPLPTLDDVQFRAYSQNTEDGMLFYVFSLIGSTNKQCVEICAGNGIECNTANFIINHGWFGLMVDGNQELIDKAKQFYGRCQDTRRYPPKFANAWISTESVNQVISYYGFQGEIDLLSLDIDGNDYWVWEAINCIDPRVVILEYQNAWGADHAVTQPYKADFVWTQHGTPLGLCGASLPAFVKLGRKKGYRLIGAQWRCNNAVFIRNGVGDDIFPEVPAEQCFTHPMAKFNIHRRIEYEKTASLMDHWVEV